MSTKTNPLDEHLNLLLTDNITDSHRNLIGHILRIESLCTGTFLPKLGKVAVKSSNTKLNQFLKKVSKGEKLADASIDNLSFDILLKLIDVHELKPKFRSKTIQNIWEVNSVHTSGKQATFHDYKGSEQDFITFVNDVFPAKQNIISIILPHSQEKLPRSYEENVRNGNWQHITIEQGEFNNPLYPLIWDVLLNSLHLPETSKYHVLKDLFSLKDDETYLLNLINTSKEHSKNSEDQGVYTIDKKASNNFTGNDATHLIANYNFNNNTYKSFSLLKPKKPQRTQGLQSFYNDISAIRQSLSYLLCQTSGHVITIKLNDTKDAQANLIAPFWWNETIKALRVENNPNAKSYVQPDCCLINLTQYTELSGKDVDNSRERILKFRNAKGDAAKRQKAFESLINSNGFNKPNFPSLLYPYCN